VHPVDLVAPDGDRAVVVPLDLAVHGAVGVGAVVLGPVELDAARDPRAREPDERRLDHAVVVDEVIVVRLVVRHLDPPAERGEDHDLQVLVLEVTASHSTSRLVSSI
jgi:tRNA(Arg) A34 adenosine deaminase TadA